MRSDCNISLNFCLDDDGFSLDELVTRIHDMLTTQGALAKLVALIIMLVQEVRSMSVVKTGKVSGIECCPGHRLVLHDSRARKFKTSLGDVTVHMRRVKCTCCGRTHSLMGKFLKLRPYSRCTNELEKTMIEACSETSYRKAGEQMVSHHLPFVPKSTAQRWVLRTDCAEISFAGKQIEEYGPIVLYGDGTGFKGVPQDGEASRGSLKVILAVDGRNNVIPLGVHTDKSWSEVSQEMKKNRVRFASGSISVTDGELGLAENLATFVDEQQRCQWHLDRDLYHALRQDGVYNTLSAPLRKKLRAIIGIDLPKEDYAPASEEAKDAIRLKMEESEEKIGELTRFLCDNGCSTAAAYLNKAKRGIFAYLRRWLTLGIACPRASSFIERIMRVLGLRLKKIGYGWSNRGAEKMAKIILKRFANEKEWKDYWDKVMCLEKTSVFVVFRGITFPQESLSV